MKTRRFPFDPGPAAWKEILPAVEPGRSIDQDTIADWLIIGAGFAGLSAARRLRAIRPGDKIVVVEARRLAEGPAGRNSGFMIDVPHDLTSADYGGKEENDRRQICENRAAIDFAADAARDFEMPAEALTRSGKINAAASERGLRHNAHFAAHLAALDEDYELLDAAAMREITGSSFFTGGLRTPGAAILQPALYIRCLAAGLQRDGVEIFENSPVTDLNRNGGAWTATMPDGRVSAPSVILAVNGHAESFGFFERALMHVFTFASMTRELTADEVARLGGKMAWACTPADPLGTTVRKIAGSGGHRLVLRNSFTFSSAMHVSDAQLRRIWATHCRSYRRRFPMLADVGMAYRWGGQLCLARNNVGAVKQLDTGLVSACCQNGLGTTKGTFAGMMAAEIAAGQPSAMANDLLNEPLPQPLPPKPLSDLGATAFIRWREFRAGIEL